MGNMSSSSSCGSISSLYSEEHNMRSIDKENESRILRYAEKWKKRASNSNSSNRGAACNYSDSTSRNRGDSVARVLMVDGQVMELKERMKVSELLSDYGGHVVCPLESLHPGQHALKRLHSDDVLQPGYVYLLLPITSRPQATAANVNASSFRVRAGQPPHLVNAPNFSARAGRDSVNTAQRNPNNYNSINNNNIDIKNINANHSDDFVDVDYHYRLQLLHKSLYKSLYSHNRRQQSAPRGQRRSSSVRPPSDVVDSHDQLRPTRSSRDYSLNRHILSNNNHYYYHDNNDDNYVQLRRCQTWTPRLQAIHETSRNIKPSQHYHQKYLFMPHVS